LAIHFSSQQANGDQPHHLAFHPQLGKGAPSIALPDSRMVAYLPQAKTLRSHRRQQV
jgi:hypothetical protein